MTKLIGRQYDLKGLTDATYLLKMSLFMVLQDPQRLCKILQDPVKSYKILLLEYLKKESAFFSIL